MKAGSKKVGQIPSTAKGGTVSMSKNGRCKCAHTVDTRLHVFKSTLFSFLSSCRFVVIGIIGRTAFFSRKWLYSLPFCDTKIAHFFTIFPKNLLKKASSLKHSHKGTKSIGFEHNVCGTLTKSLGSRLLRHSSITFKQTSSFSLEEFIRKLFGTWRSHISGWRKYCKHSGNRAENDDLMTLSSSWLQYLTENDDLMTLSSSWLQYLRNPSAVTSNGG